MASSSTSAAALSNEQVSALQQKGDFTIKSESVTPKLGASTLLAVDEDLKDMVL